MTPSDAFRLRCHCGRSYFHTVELIGCRHGAEAARRASPAKPRRPRRKATCNGEMPK
jgi:hypothetical protein